MNKNDARWLKYIPILIAVTSVLTAITAYIESDFSLEGTEYLNDATARLVVAANSYNQHVIHASSAKNAEEMVKAFNEIANTTEDEASLIQARYWEEIVRYNENMSKTAFNNYRQKMDEGFYPIKEKAAEATSKASVFVVPIILFQISSTIFVMTQITKRKSLLIFGLGTAFVGLAFLWPLVFW